MHEKSGDGHTNARHGGTDTVIEEGYVDNAEAWPERYPKRTSDPEEVKVCLERFL